MTVHEMNERKRELGLTYGQIARMSGVPESTVRKVLGGFTKAPRYATLQALSRVFGQGGAVSNVYPVPYKAADQPAILCDASSVYSANTEKRQGEYTLEDYLAFPDERRVELIDGVIYDMSAPTGYHQLIAGRLYTLLFNWISEKGGSCMPFVAPVDVQLDCDDRTIVQPDVLILCDKSKYTPARIVGAPDFVAEVLSKSSKPKDIFIKLNKYRTAGVREYWIIDPEKKKVMLWEFEDEDDYAVYSFRDRIPVGIYGGELVIDFAVIDDLVTPWM